LVATVPGVEYLSRPHYRLSSMPSVAALRGDICDVVDCRQAANSAVCSKVGPDGEGCARRFCDYHMEHGQHANLELRDRCVLTGGGRKRRNMSLADRDVPDKTWSVQEIGSMKKPMLEKALEIRNISLAPGVKPVVANMKAALISHMSDRDTGAEVDVATDSSSTSDVSELTKRLIHLEEEDKIMKHEIAHLTARKLEVDLASNILFDDDDENVDNDDDDDDDDDVVVRIKSLPSSSTLDTRN
jgi:hypothetical protein